MYMFWILQLKKMTLKVKLRIWLMASDENSKTRVYWLKPVRTKFQCLQQKSKEETWPIYEMACMLQQCLVGKKNYDV